MLKTKQYIRLLLVCSFSTAIGCQQNVSSTPFKPEPVYDGPKTEDRIVVDRDGQLVGSKAAPSADAKGGSKDKAGPVVAEQLEVRLPEGHAGTLSLAIQQYDYAVKTKNTRLKNQALQMINSVFAQPGFFKPMPIQSSPYYHLFYAQSQPEFMKATAAIGSIFNSQRMAITGALASAKIVVDAMPSVVSLDDALKITAEFVTQFENQLAASTVLKPEVKNAIRDSLNERFWIKIEKAREAIAQAAGGAANADGSAPTLTFDQALAQMLQFITQFEVQLTAEESASIQQAQNIATELNRELTGKEALAFLINLWESMPPQEREAVFSEASPELHEFLLSKDEKQRNCLKATKCKSLILRLTRNLFIVPKIKKMGVANIQKQISTAAFEKLNTAVSDAAKNAIRDLPIRLEKEIFAELDKEEARYQGYRNNYPEFLAEELSGWMTLEFGKESLVYIPKDLSAKNLSVTIMALLRLAESSKLSKKTEIQLSLLNLMLMHGGFNTLDKKGYPSLLVSRKANGKVTSVNLESFTLPVGQLGYRSDKRSDDRVILTLEERQLMMKAFRELVEQLTPSKGSEWSSRLDKVNVSSFFSKVDAEGLNKKAFPRDAFMALAVANYVSFLYDLDWQSGPLFLFCENESKMAWIGKKQECAKPTTLVSLVNLPFTKAEIKATSHAGFLNEVLAFFQFVDRIQNSKNSYLRPHLKKFSEIKPQLHKLSVTLSNFLSHTMTNENGEVCSQFNVTENKCVGTSKDIVTYRAAMQALKNSFLYLKINAYKAVVLSSYYHINQKFLSQETGLYTSMKGALKKAALLNSIDIAETASELEEQPDSKTQAEQLMLKWKKML